MENTLGSRIAALRKKKTLTQEALADELHVSPQAVSKWENAQACPDITALPKLARILGTTVDALLSGEEEATPVVQVLPPEQRKAIDDMVLRIMLDSSDGDKMRVNLPISLVKAALECGVEIQGLKGLENIDLQKILDMVSLGAVGNLLEVQSSDGDTIRIFVE